MIRGKQIICFVFVTIVFFTACNKTHIYQKYQKIPDYIWNYDNKVDFEFEIKDTNVYYDILLNLRIASLFPYSNIWLMIEKSDPDSKVLSKRRYEFTLALEDGKWVGKGLGDIIDNQFMLEKRIKFPKKGKYNIIINHDMRVDNLPAVMDIGISVQKSEEN